MNIYDIEKKRKELFDEAKVAAERRDFPQLSEAHRKLVSFHSLIEQISAIQLGAETNARPAIYSPLAHIGSDSNQHGKSDKELGEHERAKWISEYLPGLVTPIRGALYKWIKGGTLGIAYAEEKKGREDIWFLGLQAGKFDSAVLLCKTITGDRFWITLPREFVNEYHSRLSKSKNGQIKFSLIKKAGDYYLHIPNTGKVPVAAYLNKIPAQ